MSYRVVDIKDYWSPVIAETYEFVAIADAENPEFNYLWEKIYGLVDEFFVRSASEVGVIRMEKILNITPLNGQTLDERKSTILLKMNMRIPYTMRFLKNLLTSMLGEENRIVEHDNDTQTLTVKVKEGTVNLFQLRKDLNKIVPQHLVLNLEEM